jgi:hypothetical protein
MLLLTLLLMLSRHGLGESLNMQHTAALRPSNSFYARIDPKMSSFLQCIDDEDILQWIPYSEYR